MNARREEQEAIRVMWYECLTNGEYEVDGFMIPFLLRLTKTEKALILQGASKEEREAFDGALFAVRLSAPGYMDATEWTPIFSANDLREWFDMYCEKQED